MWKHLLVHVDASERAQARLELAVALARRFGAQLTGLCAESSSLGPGIAGLRHPSAMEEARAAARAAFEARAKAAGLTREWWQLERGDYGHVVGWTAICCRYVDLAIFGQHDAPHSRLPEDTLEHVLVDSGRPLLVVPAAGRFADVGKRVLVAWSGSRESARALHDALPLLQHAEDVTVLSLQMSGSGTERAPLPAVDIVAHLRMHGVQARYERTLIDEVSVVDVVLNRAADLGADLTVMGGYGLQSLPFLQRSHATRQILRSMTTPVLLSH